MRIFLDAPHAPDTLVLQRFESAEAASEDPGDARPAQDHFLVESIFEGLMNKHRRKAKLTSAHIELVRNSIDMRSRFGFDLESVIPTSSFYLPIQFSPLAHYKSSIQAKSADQI